MCITDIHHTLPLEPRPSSKLRLHLDRVIVPILEMITSLAGGAVPLMERISIGLYLVGTLYNNAVDVS